MMYFITVLKNLYQGILPNLSVGLLNIMEVTVEELKGGVPSLFVVVS